MTLQLHKSPCRTMCASPGPVAARAAQGGGSAALEAIATVLRFARHETIFNEGDAADSSFKIIAGAVRLCKMLPDGRRQIVEFRLSGDFLGLESGDKHALAAEAVGDVVIARYARTRLARLEETEPGLRQELMAMLRRDLSAARQHLIMLGRQTARERVAAFLFRLVDRKKRGDGDLIEVPMCRQDIADYLGLTIETVCREITALKQMQILAVPDRHHLIIRSVGALQAIARSRE